MINPELFETDIIDLIYLFYFAHYIDVKENEFNKSYYNLTKA